MFPDADLSTRPVAANVVRTILVVEDEELIRMVITEFLQASGYIVLEAGSVMQAKQILRHRHVDLVFSDINMPGQENGFVLEQWVRQHYPEIKVVLTSGASHPVTVTRGLLEPMIQKPYAYGAVLRRIEALLANG